MAAPVPTFRLLVVPGVTVDKWTRMWSERLPDVRLDVRPAEVTEAAALLAGKAGDAGPADAGLVRLPVDRDTFNAISLYTEATVAVVPLDHLFAAADEITMADLADETLLRPLDDTLVWADSQLPADRPATTADAVALVAAGVGILVIPQSLARLHHRRDLTYRVVTDAPTSSVALAWMTDRYSDLVEEMIGIVRGRTANSTRGRTVPPTPPAKAAPRTQGRPASGSGRGGKRSGSPSPRKPPHRRGR